jgi:hypothetical protein
MPTCFKSLCEVPHSQSPRSGQPGEYLPAPNACVRLSTARPVVPLTSSSAMPTKTPKGVIAQYSSMMVTTRVRGTPSAANWTPTEKASVPLCASTAMSSEMAPWKGKKGGVGIEDGGREHHWRFSFEWQLARDDLVTSNNRLWALEQKPTEEDP